MAALDSPSSTYMLMDSGTYTIAVESSSNNYVFIPKAPYYYIPGVGKLINSSISMSLDVLTTDFQSEGRHFDGNNVAFADGHVKWVKVSTIYNEAKKYAAGSYSDSTPSAWNIHQN